MIQYALLVALGFFLASIIFILIAPSFWKRAVRLTRMRIESTLPVSLAEIEADKDQLRATFAVKIRRLEAALTKTKEKSAHQLVEISRLQMMITGLRDQVAALERGLEERRNAASVFELTIKRRFPELENALASTQSLLEMRSFEVNDLNNKMKRRDEMLVNTQRSFALQQAELARLRDAMEKSGAERSGRFKKRPSQWTLDEYRSEYDRLNVELSKLRDQLSTAYDREANQISFLKAELQQLGEQLMTSAALARSSRDEAASALRGEAGDDRDAHADKPQRPVSRRGASASRLVQQPQPWAGRDADAEVEPLDKSARISPFTARRRGQGIASNWHDFADKSLEEVLEAALPIAGEVLDGEAAGASQPLTRDLAVDASPEPRAARNRDLPRHLPPSIREPIMKRPRGQAMRDDPESAKIAEGGIAMLQASTGKDKDLAARLEIAPAAAEVSEPIEPALQPPAEVAVPEHKTAAARDSSTVADKRAAADDHAKTGADNADADYPAKADKTGAALADEPAPGETAADAALDALASLKTNGAAKLQTESAPAERAVEGETVAPTAATALGDNETGSDDEGGAKRKRSLLDRLRGVTEPVT